MRARWTTIIAVALTAIALGGALHLRKATEQQTKPSAARRTLAEGAKIGDAPAASPASAAADAPAHAGYSESVVDVRERAQFNERAREFFAQAPGLSPVEVRERAADLSQELSRIEQSGGLSAGETFLLRAGLIQYTVADEQQQVTQIRALKERYAADARRRNALAAAQSDPMFELYKVRESQIVAETLSLQVIPNGLSRDEYLRRRLQAEREQLLGGQR